MCHCFSVLLRYSPPVTFHPTNFYVIHNQFHKQDFKNYLLFWYILETRDMNCKKTKMKRFHCLQGAAIKSKCFPVSRLYIILYDSRTNHKLDVLVRWSTLYGAYNWNKYHEVFQISIHYHSTEWYIRLMSKSYWNWWTVVYLTNVFCLNWYQKEITFPKLLLCSHSMHSKHKLRARYPDIDG